MEISVTVRTKSAVRRWAGLAPTDGLVLDDKLEDLRPDATNELRVEVNREFKGEKTFPIGTVEWGGLGLTTVRDLRDEVAKRL